MRQQQQQPNALSLHPCTGFAILSLRSIPIDMHQARILSTGRGMEKDRHFHLTPTTLPPRCSSTPGGQTILIP